MGIDGERMLPCPGVEMFLDSNDDLYLLPIPGREQLRIDAPWGRWVRASLGGQSLASMPLELAEEIARIIDWLVDMTFVRPERSLRSDATQHWDRQVRWLAQESGDGPERQQRLMDATVLVVGVGGLGSTVADLLARAGVGTLILADDDSVEAANLARQTLFAASDVGRLKVDAAASRLRAIAPEVRVERSSRRIRGSGDVAALFAAHDPQLVFCAADRPPVAIKSWVEDAASAYGVAVMHGGHRPPLVYAGPFFVPGLSCCYECFARSRAGSGTERLEAELAVWRDTEPPQLPAVGWGDSAAASLLVGQCVQWLTGIADPALLGRELELDLTTLQTRWINGPDIPQCPRCDGARTMPTSD
jgi:bacteriocin biosynthesis cyclodehydratase domain-containing protein